MITATDGVQKRPAAELVCGGNGRPNQRMIVASYETATDGVQKRSVAESVGGGNGLPNQRIIVALYGGCSVQERLVMAACVGGSDTRHRKQNLLAVTGIDLQPPVAPQSANRQTIDNIVEHEQQTSAARIYDVESSCQQHMQIATNSGIVC